MIFTDEEKENLIKVEIELIELSFKVSDRLGEIAVSSALKNFHDLLCRAYGKKILSSMDMEYRKFAIDLAKSLPENLLPKAMRAVLGLSK